VLFTIHSISDLPSVASAILNCSDNQKIFLFYGDMGAGKTTLIKFLCEHLGTTGPVTSPTFSIVNEYVGEKHKIYHFDFFRLKNQTEALDMGYEEYFYSNAFCFIEWPEKINGLLPDHYVKIQMQVTGNGTREIIVEKI
jgi:tRNA threonylcarbamoyladenosine biosynthesis protein TsaE